MGLKCCLVQYWWIWLCPFRAFTLLLSWYESTVTLELMERGDALYIQELKCCGLCHGWMQINSSEWLSFRSTDLGCNSKWVDAGVWHKASSKRLQSVDKTSFVVGKINPAQYLSSSAMSVVWLRHGRCSAVGWMYCLALRVLVWWCFF